MPLIWNLSQMTLHPNLYTFFDSIPIRKNSIPGEILKKPQEELERFTVKIYSRWLLQHMHVNVLCDYLYNPVSLSNLLHADVWLHYTHKPWMNTTEWDRSFVRKKVDENEEVIGLFPSHNSGEKKWFDRKTRATNEGVTLCVFSPLWWHAPLHFCRAIKVMMLSMNRFRASARHAAAPL